jgi:hypothetical protein
MAFKGKVVMSSKKMETLRKRIIKLAQTKLQTGHFQESGEHPTAEMSYADLANHLSVTFPPRSLLPDVSSNLRVGGMFSKVMNQSIENYLYRNKPLNASLDSIGSNMTSYAKSLFGVPSANNPSNSPEWADFKGADSPLVFEGYLKDSWAWKNTSDNNIKYGVY